jgi:hypothetical protein
LVVDKLDVLGHHKRLKGFEEEGTPAEELLVGVESATEPRSGSLRVTWSRRAASEPEVFDRLKPAAKEEPTGSLDGAASPSIR